MTAERSTSLTLGRALATLEAFTDALPIDRARLIPSGAVRRFEPIVDDLTLLAVAADPAPLLDAIAAAVPDEDIHQRTARALTLVFQRDTIQIRVLDPAPAGAACAVLHETGSEAHVEQLRALAQRRGYALDATALRRLDTGALVPCETEADVYAALDLPYVPPELRHGVDELDGAPPANDLVTLDDIRGDLHVHTLWSDGRDTPEAIVRAARALGYEYLAITDHSETARCSRTLTIGRLREQIEDVKQLRERYPDIVILQGAEVDILQDGQLDFPDEILAELDIVLASLHDHNGQPATQLLERYVRAMRHPLVNIVTHPANRVPGQWEGYLLDYDTMFNVAAETGTALEIDGAPGHLDLDGHLARRAVAAGATVVIDSDGHFAERLGRQMVMGIGTARRGGVRTAQVLNARPVDDVREFIARKRRP